MVRNIINGASLVYRMASFPAYKFHSEYYSSRVILVVNFIFSIRAEGAGFEPAMTLRPYIFSKDAH